MATSIKDDERLQSSIDEIVLQIKTGKVIPIVGYDLLFNEFEENATERDFLKLIIKKHTKDDNLELKYERAKTGYELINEVYHDLANKATFKQRLSRTIQENRINWQLIPDSYRKLVSIRHFNLFINGTFTNTLELALNAYRAQGMGQEEIKSSYSILNFHPFEPDDLPEAAPTKFHIGFKKPVIYNFFGTHDDESGDYILTDADFIELIYDLIQDKKEKFKNLVSYLNGAYLLFLGCNFPDWFFRFFIRICVGDRLDNASNITRKAVIDSLANMQKDSSRSVFISQYRIQTLDIDCNALIDEIYKRLKNENGLVSDTCNNNIFISYCYADRDFALEIAKQFEGKYIEYFLDVRDLDTGDNLNDEITSAIDKCCVFLPIVSDNIIKSTAYVWNEWKYAVSRGKTIWPIFKDPVNRDLLIPPEYGITSEIRDKILNKNNTLGMMPEGDNHHLSELNLKKLKQKQYLCRVKGNKYIPKID